MAFNTPKEKILYIFFGFFVANAVIAELISVKLFDFGEVVGLPKDTYIMALGLLPWPIVFLATDALNEFYGKKIVRQLSIVTSCLLLYVFMIIWIVDHMQAWNHADILQAELLKQNPNATQEELNNVLAMPGITNTQFHTAYAQSGPLIFGSVIAFLVGQFVDITLFSLFKRASKGRYIWLRATGSTVISQFIDTVLVIGIGFYLPGYVTGEQYWNMILTGYFIKLLFAVSLTPLVYAVHFVMKKFFKLESVNYAQA
ncbi:MAG TPA: queuosine precursor transporter [Flavobacteriales bacterium]|nr:queuosine precursor transporter [Flavobacteriales bacterium]